MVSCDFSILRLGSIYAVILKHENEAIAHNWKRNKNNKEPIASQHD